MPYKVLIVDDEVATTFGLKAVLESPEVEILTSLSEADSKKLLDGKDIDVLITDIRLTGCLDFEGLTLLAYAKENSPKTKVILMTGYGDPALMQKAFSMGADFYYEKPIELNVLCAALRNSGVPISLPREGT